MSRLLLPLLAVLASLALLGPTGAQGSPAYIALGDSLAFGVGASDLASKGYVALVHEWLQRSDAYRERGLDLINLSVPGATSADLLLPEGQLERALAEIQSRNNSSTEDDVEIITIDIGGNDLLNLLPQASTCSSDPQGEECQKLLGPVLESLRDNLNQVVQELRKAAPQAEMVILDLYNPYSGTGDALESTADMAVQRVNEVLREVALQPDLEARLASVYELFRGRGKQWIAEDGIHPNDEGHAVLAEAVLAALEGRAPSLPEELAATPPDQEAAAPAPSAEALPQQEPDSGGGFPIVLAVVIPLGVLLAAAALSLFLARRRGWSTIGRPRGR